MNLNVKAPRCFLSQTFQPKQKVLIYWRVWLLLASLEEGSNSAQSFEASAGKSQGPCWWAAFLPALSTGEGSALLAATGPALKAFQVGLCFLRI